MKYEDCKTEQAFKMEWIRQHKKEFMELFCIETEETVKGFPDVLGIRGMDVLDGEFNVVAKVQTPSFFEFKLARKGRIKFQPTQPAFYKAHKELDIEVISLAEHKGKYYVVGFKADVIFEENGSFEINGNNEVDLRDWLEFMEKKENDSNS